MIVMVVVMMVFMIVTAAALVVMVMMVLMVVTAAALVIMVMMVLMVVTAAALVVMIVMVVVVLYLLQQLRSHIIRRLFDDLKELCAGKTADRCCHDSGLRILLTDHLYALSHLIGICHVCSA